MTRLTLKATQEYAQQHGYELVKSKVFGTSRYPYTLQISPENTSIVTSCNYKTLANVINAIEEGFMLTGDYCALRPTPSDEPWDGEPTKPNSSDDGDEPTDSRRLAVSFAPQIKVLSVSSEQNTAQICVGELIKTVNIDEQGISEEPQVIVSQRRGNQTLTSKVKLVVAYYSELMVPSDEVGFYAFPLSAHGGHVSWISPPQPYTAEQFKIAYCRRG